jgi:hypothetical protein
MHSTTSVFTIQYIQTFISSIRAAWFALLCTIKRILFFLQFQTVLPFRHIGLMTPMLAGY